MDVRIRQVENGFIVYDSPKERFETTGNEYVFETSKTLFAHLEKCFNLKQETSG